MLAKASACYGLHSSETLLGIQYKLSLWELASDGEEWILIN